MRAIIAALLWIGSLFILSAQLTAIGWILNVVAGIPRPIGCIVGGVAISVYFAAGGLLTAAWVNVVQLTVKIAGFAVALPLAVSMAGGWGALAGVRTDDPAYLTFWRPDTPGLMYLAAARAGVHRVAGAAAEDLRRARRSDRAHRRRPERAGAVSLRRRAGRARHRRPADAFRSSQNANLALPMVLMYGVPPLVGALGLAAVFSAEISAADAVLFMLTTSLSQDLYKRFVDPSASDARVLQVARWTTVVSGAFGVALAIVLADVIESLTIFYTLLGVSLFVPIVAGLYVPRTTSGGALASIAAGVGGMLAVQVMTGGQGWGPITPALGGLLASLAAWVISLAVGSTLHEGSVDDRRGSATENASAAARLQRHLSVSAARMTRRPRLQHSKGLR